MENLTTKKFEFTTIGTQFVGQYVGADDNGFKLEDQKTIQHYIEKTPHTEKAISQIKEGDVILIEKTARGHDVFLYSLEEKTAWENGK